MHKIALALLLLVPVALSAQSRAKNVVLFLADAGGLSTLAAASMHAHGDQNRLFIQRMPHIALSDTTTASQVVSDSAAGMTAIVTGQRTHNGVISQSASAVVGKQDGEPLKTILEYAEERGLSTGVISNDSMTGATPASTYAHVNARSKSAEIFQQIFTPRFGDGVDVLIGSGRPAITKALAAANLEAEALGQQHKRPVLSSMDEIPADATQAIVLLERNDFDVQAAVNAAHRILSKNKKGYVLVVEVDTHTNDVQRGLDRMVTMDRVIEQTSRMVGRDTLLLFTADHSFDIQLRGGRLGEPYLAGIEEAQAKSREEKRRDVRIPTIRMDDGHTGEPVIAAAQGPGAERVRGFMKNTDLFHVMMRALGWKE